MPLTNPTVKAAWIAALRSGRYPQGRDVLCTVDGHYCCLGVLCEVLQYPRDFLYGEDTDIVYLLPYGDGETYRAFAFLPDGVEGLTLTEIDHLSTMNDLDGKSFTEIADYIEAYL